MPFNELQRRDSWPPTQIRISSPTSENDTSLSEIDENPISFFLTSPEELDFLDDDGLEDLSAGIEGFDSKSFPIREVSPSSLQREPLPEEEEDSPGDEEEEVGFGVGMPLSLKDFTKRHNDALLSTRSGRRSRASNSRENDDEFDVNETLKGLGISIPSKRGRGRAKVRLVPNNGRGRGKTRSLSARRPASWRVPSPDIWRIDEEDEEKGSGNGTEIFSSSAPATTAIEQVEMAMRAKPKKKVRWAL